MVRLGILRLQLSALVLVVMVTSCQGASPTATPVTSMRAAAPVTMFAEILGRFSVGNPHRVFVRTDGSLWVTNPELGFVTKLSPQGGGRTVVDLGREFDNVQVDASGMIWATYAFEARLWKFAPDGRDLGSIQVAEPIPGLLVEEGGNAWGLSEEGNVFRITPSGVQLVFAVGRGLGNGMATGADGVLWVTSIRQGTITKLSTTGAPLGTFPAGPSPGPVAAAPDGSVWVLNTDGAVTKLSPEGARQGTFPVGAVPHRVVVDSGGNAWVSYNDGRLTRLAPDGTLVGTVEVGGQISHVAFEADGNILVAGGLEGNLTRISSRFSAQPVALPATDPATGSVLATYPVGKFPDKIAVAPAGDFWVNSQYVLYHLSASGTVIGTATYEGVIYKLAIDPRGDLWVLASDSRSFTLRRYAPEGKVLATFSLAQPYGDMAIAPDGSFWLTFRDIEYTKDNESGNPGVINKGNSTLTRLSADGKFLATYKIGQVPTAIDVDANGNVWIAHLYDHRVTQLAPNGTVMAEIPVGQFPLELKVATDGNVWVVDGNSATVSKLAPNGQLLGTFRTGGSIHPPRFDQQGNVWLLSSHSLTKLSPAGAILGNFGAAGLPSGMAIAADGSILVATGARESVLKLAP